RYLYFATVRSGCGGTCRHLVRRSLCHHRRCCGGALQKEKMKVRPRLILILSATGVVVTLLLSCARGPVAVRAYLFSGEPTPPGYGAYGYLVFNAQPSESESKRYQRVCDSFRRQLAVETWGTEGQRGNQMATFWPLKIERSTEVNSWQCQKLIENYDYRKSAEIATVIHKQAASGPILAAWKKPFEENGSSEALVLDLSDFADEDLDRAFGIWRDRITRDPAFWRKGFNVVLCREAM